MLIDQEWAGVSAANEDSLEDWQTILNLNGAKEFSTVDLDLWPPLTSLINITLLLLRLRI